MIDSVSRRYDAANAALDAANLGDGVDPSIIAERDSARSAMQKVCPHAVMRREGQPSRLAVAWRCDRCQIRHVPAGTLVRASGEGNSAWLETATHSIGWKDISSLEGAYESQKENPIFVDGLMSDLYQVPDVQVATEVALLAQIVCGYVRGRTATVTRTGDDVTVMSLDCGDHIPIVHIVSASEWRIALAHCQGDPSP